MQANPRWYKKFEAWTQDARPAEKCPCISGAFSLKYKKQESKKETDNSSEKLNIHYYLDENDFVWVENDKRVYRYNYKTGGPIPTDKSVDLMKWHEFPESELPDMIKLKQNLFSQDISD